jgi:predicted nucleotidyltransferase
MPHRWRISGMKTELRGENQIRMFQKIAERLTSKLALCEGVEGIVFIGGLVRGFVDRFSDLDVIVLLDRQDEDLRRRIYEIGLDEERRSGVEPDLTVHSLEDFRKTKLDEPEKWELSRADVVFDPRGEVKKAFERKLRLGGDFWVRRIAICTEYLKWYCCPPRKDVGTIAEAWIERGDLASAHYCLNYGVELLVRMLFALNREFLPAPKWRLFYSYSLKWLPEGYKSLIRQALLVNESSVEEHDRRLKVIRKIWRRTMAKAEEEAGLSLVQLSKYYVEKVLHQRGIPSRQ